MIKGFVTGFCLLALLGGCASNVTRHADTNGTHYVQDSETVTSIAVTYSDAGKNDLADNVQFNGNELVTRLKNVLSGERFYTEGSGSDSLEVQITAIRVRSTFNAVMWGFMAGSDNVTGEVFLRDPQGRVVNHFQVHAGYALGGLGGGWEGERMGWLYDKFAQLTVANLTGSQK